MKILKRIIIIILIIIAALAVAAGVLLWQATRDNIPPVPDETDSIEDIAQNSLEELFNDEYITLDTADVNCLLGEVEEASADLLTSGDVEIKDLFIILENDEANFYCRVKYRGITFPIQAGLLVSYENPYIVLSLDAVRLGNLNIPKDIISDLISEKLRSDEVEISGESLRYDTTRLNTMLLETANDAIGGVSLTDNADINDLIKSILKSVAESVIGSISIGDVAISGDTLEIKVDVVYEPTKNEDSSADNDGGSTSDEENGDGGTLWDPEISEDLINGIKEFIGNFSTAS